MYLYNEDELIKIYKISLGFSFVGEKVREGDGETPEGIYYISAKNEKSSFYLSLKISYPSDYDIENAKSMKFSPGGNIMIHGLSPFFVLFGRFQTLVEWTKGCIAIANSEI